MKFKKLILIGSLALGLTQVTNGQTIVGSAHDFSSAAWNNASPISTNLQGQICLPCHAPHNTNDTTAGLNAPLWNHKLSTASYTLYSGYKFDGASSIGQPDGSSKLCLSCHDGTVALASFRSYTGTTFMSGSSLLGTDLSNDHPISFTYDAALATTDGALYDPTSQLSGLAGGGTIDHDMLESHKIQCKSCHDPHNGGGSGVTHLLIKSNTSSALCLTCHKK
jgi:predicted CXXCH cytochrome family protein